MVACEHVAVDALMRPPLYRLCRVHCVNYGLGYADLRRSIYLRFQMLSAILTRSRLEFPLNAGGSSPKMCHNEHPAPMV